MLTQKMAIRTADTTTEVPPYVKHAYDLPNEIWHRIFSFLPFREMVVSVATVCKRWHAFAHDPRLWRRLVVRGRAATALPVMRRVLGGALLLQQLRLDKYPDIDGIVELLYYDFDHLVAIDFADSHISSLSWQRITTCAQWPLRRFGLSDSTVTDDVIANVTAHFPHLEVLNLNRCWRLCDVSLVTIACTLPRLRSLSITQTMAVTDSGVFALVEHLGDVLEYLNLDCFKLTVAGFQSLSGFRRLHGFGVLCLRPHTNATLLGVFQKLGRHLTRFSLVGSTVIEAGLCALFDMNPDMSRVTHLGLSWCDDVTDAVLAAVVHCCGALLVWLDIENAQAVTDAGLAPIFATSAAGGGALTHLNISGLRQVTDDALRHVTTQLPRLRYLIASNCIKVSDALLTQLHTALPAAAIYNSRRERVGSPDQRDGDLTGIDLHVNVLLEVDENF